MLRNVLFIVMAMVGLVVFSTAGMAQDIPPMQCESPGPPPTFNSQKQIDEFLAKVDVYQSCVDNYANEMNELCSRAQEAARQAVQEFNDYANSIVIEQ